MGLEYVTVNIETILQCSLVCKVQHRYGNIYIVFWEPDRTTNILCVLFFLTLLLYSSLSLTVTILYICGENGSILVPPRLYILYKGHAEKPNKCAEIY